MRDAGADGRLLPLFVLDPHLLGHDRVAPARLVHLRHALADLSSALRSRGSVLHLAMGRPDEVVADLATRVGADAVHVSADHSPLAVARDEAVRGALAAEGVEMREHPGVAIQPPGSVRTGAGGVYKVFTPFFRTWSDLDPGTPLPAPRTLPPPPDGAPAGLAISEVAALQVEGPPLPWTDGTDLAADGGETAARRRMARWLEDGVEDYDDRRDALAVAGTSRLSADLHLGCLSPRELLHHLDRSAEGPHVYASELAWRDFYLHVLAEWPHAARSAFRREHAGLDWVEDPEGFDAWREGRTGFPVVDAAMRQLRQTGWMHNRARMIVASFLCKDLLIDWRLGEAHFMAHLVDGDTASNNGGWQWAAGTGTDAQPFVRIFNPTTQGRRFDPDGAYVRRFVPELADVPDARIHEPWRLTEDEQRRCGVRIGVDYPLPIVDHAEARQRALDWWSGRS